ncbi:hypothetical protein WDV06_00670 [Streptomyces racemochromogenes]|uniref:Uncharacterized protein n=1 Tax=Streptomyces racemochromogenes TaxID=67353 RepID=A0ABW7P5K4_9ACTN
MTEQTTGAPETPVPPAAEAPVASGGAVPPAAEAPVPPTPGGRRTLRAVLRWTAAVLVFGVAGAGTAYGITRLERSDVPGLSTKDDGRWTYPVLARPTPPPGAPLPFAPDNPDGIHYAGLTQLLLPAPQGSAPDAGLKLEKDSAVTVDTFLEEYEPSVRDTMRQQFDVDGLRQIAARGWTTADGTRTRVYLLRFHASGFADRFKGCGSGMELSGVKGVDLDEVWGKAKVKQVSPAVEGIKVLEEAVPFGDEQTRVGCVASGDLQAVILQNRKGGAAAVPLHQAVILQDQLLH